MHEVLHIAIHAFFDAVDLLIQARSQVLHFEEALVNQRLAFPSVNVLPDQSVGYLLKKLTCWQWDVVPSLPFQ